MPTTCHDPSLATDVVRLRCGRASAVVCPCCSSLALEIGNVALRMPCAHFPELSKSIQSLAGQLAPNQSRAALALGGTGVTLRLTRYDLRQLGQLALDLISNETFRSCCEVCSPGSATATEADRALIN